MNDFDFDCKEKKRIARGAYAKKGTKSKRCTLPGDFLTAAEKKKLSTTLVEANLKKPMTLGQFKALPTNIKREYLEFLRDECGGTLKSVAQMFGVNPQSFCKYIRLNEPTLKGIFPVGKPYADVAKEREKKWSAWIAESTEKTPAHDLIPGTETVEDRYSLVFKPKTETPAKSEIFGDNDGVDETPQEEPLPLVNEISFTVRGYHSVDDLCRLIRSYIGDRDVGQFSAKMYFVGGED